VVTIKLTEAQIKILVQLIENTSFAGRDWRVVKELLDALTTVTEG
jgi:hypothetical protein